MIEPLATPVEVGSKLTCRLNDCPGLRVVGKVAPEDLNSAPVRAAEVIITGPVPEEVRVRVLVEVEFNTTFPYGNVAALTVNCGVTPVPLKLIIDVRAVVPELLAMETDPVTEPAAEGSKLT